MQCPIKGDTAYFTAVQFWILRRALQLQRKGQKHFPLQFWKQLYFTGPELRMAAKAVEKELQHSPDMTKCSLPQLSSYSGLPDITVFWRTCARCSIPSLCG